MISLTIVIHPNKQIYLLAKGRVRMRTTYDLRDTFQIQKGVLQGETVSTILWICI